MNVPVEYEQTDPRWRNIMYSGTNNPRETIGTDGCGPTCAAMVAATLRSDKIKPDAVAKWFMQNGGVSPRDGTYWFIFGKYFSYLKIPCTQTNSDAMAKQALAKDWMVITAMGKGQWTSVGHFILAYGLSGSKVKIHDPNSEASYRELGDQTNYFNEAAQYWIIQEDWKKVDIKDIPIYMVDNKSKVYVKGAVEDGTTYIKLRDVEKLFPVSIGWDAVGKVATLSLNYKE